jgi:hypothetical protein
MCVASFLTTRDTRLDTTHTLIRDAFLTSLCHFAIPSSSVTITAETGGDDKDGTEPTPTKTVTTKIQVFDGVLVRQPSVCRVIGRVVSCRVCAACVVSRVLSSSTDDHASTDGQERAGTAYADKLGTRNGRHPGQRVAARASDARDAPLHSAPDIRQVPSCPLW